MTRLIKIKPISLARIFCVLHAFIGVLMGIISALIALSGQEADGIWSLGAWALLVFPLVNAGLGFLTGLFLAGAYNFLSRRMGAIEFDVEKT